GYLIEKSSTRDQRYSRVSDYLFIRIPTRKCRFGNAITCALPRIYPISATLRRLWSTILRLHRTVIWWPGPASTTPAPVRCTCTRQQTAPWHGYGYRAA